MNVSCTLFTLHLRHITHLLFNNLLDPQATKPNLSATIICCPAAQVQVQPVSRSNTWSQCAPVTAHGAARPAARRFPLKLPLPPLPMVSNVG